MFRGSPLLLNSPFLLLDQHLCIHRSGADGADIPAGSFVKVRLTRLLAIGTPDKERLVFFRFWHCYVVRWNGITICTQNIGKWQIRAILVSIMDFKPIEFEGFKKADQNII